jgi:hypothetical protein
MYISVPRDGKWYQFSCYVRRNPVLSYLEQPTIYLDDVVIFEDKGNKDFDVSTKGWSK